MTVIQEPEKLSKKVGIPLAILVFSASIWVWFVPNTQIIVKVFCTMIFPITSLMILSWTKFKEDK